MQLANKAKALAQARRELMEKVRQASGTGIRVFERSMSSDLQVPNRTRGLSFLAALLLFLSFIVIVSYESFVERDALEGNQVWNAVAGYIGTAMSCTSRDALTGYVSHNLSTLDVQNAVIDNAVRIGSVRIRVVRSVSTCHVNSEDSLWQHELSSGSENNNSLPLSSTNNGGAVSCSVDVNGMTNVNQSSFVGPESGVAFPFHMDERLCIGALCSIDLTSAADQTISYPFAGNDVYMHGGSMVEWNTTSNSWTTLPNVSMLALAHDLIDARTRLVLIEWSMFNPSLNLATSAQVLFELPSAGGVIPSLVVQSVPMFDTRNPRSIFLLVYAVVQILLQLYALVQSLRHTFDCVTCSQTSTLIVFKCVKCRCPCELRIGKVSLCGSCGMPIPALSHSCWRSVAFDVWRMLAIVSVSALLTSRFATMTSVEHIKELVNDPVLGVSSSQTVAMVSLTQAFSIYRQGVSSLLVTIICTYIRLFYYACRGQTASHFARVLQYSLGPLTAFTINFLVVYSGFCFALVMVGGQKTANFATLSNAYLTSFRILLSQIGWNELGVVSPSMLLLLVLFFVVVSCMMFNIFPSVLSVSYKKAIRTPYYDVDVLSMWQLLKRYILQPTGMIRRRGSVAPLSGRKKAGSTMSNTSLLAASAMSPSAGGGGGGSATPDGTTERVADDRASVISSDSRATDETSRQIAALRAGAAMEDLMSEEELRHLMKRTEDLVLRLAEQEDRRAAQEAALQQKLGALEEMLSRRFSELLIQSESELLRKGQAASSSLSAEDAAALAEARRVLEVHRDEIEMLTTRHFALPIVEDTSLLDPLPGPWLPYRHSDEDDSDVEAEEGPTTNANAVTVSPPSMTQPMNTPPSVDPKPSAVSSIISNAVSSALARTRSASLLLRKGRGKDLSRASSQLTAEALHTANSARSLGSPNSSTSLRSSNPGGACPAQSTPPPSSPPLLSSAPEMVQLPASVRQVALSASAAPPAAPTGALRQPQSAAGVVQRVDVLPGAAGLSSTIELLCVSSESSNSGHGDEDDHRDTLGTRAAASAAAPTVDQEDLA